MTHPTRLGNYRVEDVIYEGDYAILYTAVQVHLDRRVALKVLRPDAHDELPAAMLREARFQAMVQHRHVLTIYEAFEVEGLPVLALEYVQTQALADLLERKTLPLRTGLQLFKGVVRGMRALHVKNLVHRDLKPENILLKKVEGRVVAKIADFGLAKLLNPDEAPRPMHLSETFRYLGTPEYMAPEQARSPGHVDTRADIFSLGCLLYELTTHQVCFEAETPVEAMVKVARGDYRPAGDVVECPPGLSSLIDALVHTDPVQRVQTCEALLQRLDAIAT